MYMAFMKLKNVYNFPLESAQTFYIKQEHVYMYVSGIIIKMQNLLLAFFSKI